MWLCTYGGKPDCDTSLHMKLIFKFTVEPFVLLQNSTKELPLSRCLRLLLIMKAAVARHLSAAGHRASSDVAPDVRERSDHDDRPLDTNSHEADLQQQYPRLTATLCDVILCVTSSATSISSGDVDVPEAELGTDGDHVDMAPNREQSAEPSTGSHTDSDMDTNERLPHDVTQKESAEDIKLGTQNSSASKSTITEVTSHACRDVIRLMPWLQSQLVDMVIAKLALLKKGKFCT